MLLPLGARAELPNGDGRFWHLSRHELESFLGLATFYAPATPTMTAPRGVLQEVFNEYREFRWTEMEEEAYRQVIESICGDAYLAQPD